jgi:transcriptional regulator with XRE-family HTH domain
MKKIKTDIDTKPICMKLKAFRKYILAETNQAKFCKKLNISPSALQNYEKDRLPPFELLIKIHEKFPKKDLWGYLFSEKLNGCQKGVMEQAGEYNNNISDEALIKKFIDKGRAHKLNMLALKIEQVDFDKLNEVINFMEFILAGIGQEKKQNCA